MKRKPLRAITAKVNGSKADVVAVETALSSSDRSGAIKKEQNQAGARNSRRALGGHETDTAEVIVKKRKIENVADKESNNVPEIKSAPIKPNAQVEESDAPKKKIKKRRSVDAHKRRRENAKKNLKERKSSAKISTAESASLA